MTDYRISEQDRDKLIKHHEIEHDTHADIADKHAEIASMLDTLQPIDDTEPEPEPGWEADIVVNAPLDADYAQSANDVLGGKSEKFEDFHINGGKTGVNFRQSPEAEPMEQLVVRNGIIDDFQAHALFIENVDDVVIDNVMLRGVNMQRKPTNGFDHCMYITASNSDLTDANVRCMNGMSLGGWYGCKLRGQHLHAFGDIVFRNWLFVDFVEAIGAKPNYPTSMPQRRILCENCIFAYTKSWRLRMLEEEWPDYLIRPHKAGLVKIDEGCLSIGTLSRADIPFDAITGMATENVALGQHIDEPLDDSWRKRLRTATPGEHGDIMQQLHDLV